MATQQEEEQQVKEFLKRAEIRTMKKDLRQLREKDALKERDKIVKIKTLEEQQAEEAKKIQERELAKQKAESAGVEKVLGRQAEQEKIAEENIKDYASETERQQIFLLESERFNLENQIKAFETEKEPALKLEENNLLIEKRNWEQRLNSILAEEKKLEEEQKFIVEKDQASQIPEEKKALEKRKWELDSKIQEIEKRRWKMEKQMQEIDGKIKEVGVNAQQFEQEKNKLREKIAGIDKTLREIYTIVISRTEQKRKGQEAQQKITEEKTAGIRAKEKEEIQHQQWTHPAESGQVRPALKQTAPAASGEKEIPKDFKEKMAKSFDAEEEQRKKFLQDIEAGTNKNAGQPQQKSNIK